MKRRLTCLTSLGVALALLISTGLAMAQEPPRMSQGYNSLTQDLFTTGQEVVVYEEEPLFTSYLMNDYWRVASCSFWNGCAPRNPCWIRDCTSGVISYFLDDPRGQIAVLALGGIASDPAWVWVDSIYHKGNINSRPMLESLPAAIPAAAPTPAPGANCSLKSTSWWLCP